MQAPKPPSRRLQRVSELIKRELAELIRRELSVEKIGLLNINEVKVAPDLKNALVFVGHVGRSINVDQEADTGNDQCHQHRQRIKVEGKVGFEAARRNPRRQRLDMRVLAESDGEEEVDGV